MSFGSNALKNNLSKPKGAIGKKIAPGIVKAKVFRISTSTRVWKGVDRLFLHLHIETEPIAGFEGFYIDKSNTKLGRHAGQIGDVKTTGFGYDDGRKDNEGNIITKEDSVVMFLDSLCYEANGSTWVKDAIMNKTYKSLEDFIAGFNKENPIKDVFLTYCIGGTQDKNDDGYPIYFLNLPQYKKGYRLYANDANIGLLLPFDRAEHVYVKAEPAQVVQFDADEDDDIDMPEIPTVEDAEYVESSDEEGPYAMDADIEDDFDIE